jgi:enterochelin esterase family protein
MGRPHGQPSRGVQLHRRPLRPRYNQERDWFYNNVQLARALEDKGYDLNYTWGIGNHGQVQGGAILPEIMRWLWRDHGVSTDPNDAVERSFNEPAQN